MAVINHLAVEFCVGGRLTINSNEMTKLFTQNDFFHIYCTYVPRQFRQ